MFVRIRVRQPPCCSNRSLAACRGHGRLTDSLVLLHAEMDSGQFLVLLGFCGLVVLQAEPLTGGQDDVRVLLQQLMVKVDRLERDRGRSQVAFSASLASTSQWTHQGPFENVSPLVFREVKTNIGNAYDPDTGVFTAPTNGLYYVRFTGSIGKSGSLTAAVLKNGENMFAIYNTVGRISSDANGMTLVLNEGDRVWVVLWPNQSISDQSGLSTFSGFLIFPM